MSDINCIKRIIYTKIKESLDINWRKAKKYSNENQFVSKIKPSK
jgi:hypothetical protein